MNNMYHASFLRNNNLKLYDTITGYLLADQDDGVLMTFAKKTSFTSTSMKVSVRKEPTLKYALKAECYFGGMRPLEIVNFELMDVSVFNFICQCYQDSIDYKVKGNPFSERARAIQKKAGLPWEICKLLANLQTDEEIINVYHALDDARLYGFSKDNGQRLLTMLATSASKREKRLAFKELLGKEVYESLELETRGNKYLDALATYLSSNYIQELVDDVLDEVDSYTPSLITPQDLLDFNLDEDYESLLSSDLSFDSSYEEDDDLVDDEDYLGLYSEGFEVPPLYPSLKDIVSDCCDC